MKPKHLLPLAALGLLTHTARADVFTWSGLGTTANWSDGGNWVGGIAPANDGTADIEIGFVS